MRNVLFAAFIAFSCTACTACNSPSQPAEAQVPPIAGQPAQTACQFVADGWGPTGTIPLHVEKVISGLNVPWGIAFLPGGDWLISERPGSLRLVKNGSLVTEPVLTLKTGESDEGGILGIAADPRFDANHFFYVYYTALENGESVNRVERFILSSDHTQAVSNRVILDGIKAGTFHDGGRIKFGPDAMLYVSTGDARTPELAQDVKSLNGKILRVTNDGAAPADNPIAGSPVYVMGVRNVEAFDFIDFISLMVVDHGPTGELGLTGRDEVSVAHGGSNLGWPVITGCETHAGMVTPLLSWNTAAPPGGAAIYLGSAIPEFAGNLLIGMLGMGDNPAAQLHRVVFDPFNKTLVSHEVYLKGQYGRLREVIQSPDGVLYITTSNCDGRGICPLEKDSVLKITHG